ncbi:MAG TPA: primosomal protein N' [Paenalcaligenes sp.]|nr:primosomal protein N' [Paenalcaligenes sp.]
MTSSQAAENKKHWLQVVLDVPLRGPFDYWHEAPVATGNRVLVTFGRRKLVGIVTGMLEQPHYDPAKVRAIEQVLDDLPPLPADWLAMGQFAARYYQRPLGEVLLPSLPPPLRTPAAYTGKRSAGGPVARLRRRKHKSPAAVAAVPAPELSVEQQKAVAAIGADSAGRFLLYGVTGSGKTEVYLHAALQVLQAGRQVLFLVPEINLTPQFELSLRQRLQDEERSYSIQVMHSGLAQGARLRSWLAAYEGEADVLLGTRMSVFTPMPRLGLIIVDEEHDASYKQQEGLRYSARDLAVWRAHQAQIPVVLGSATPALESWAHAQQDNYRCLRLTQRARAMPLPDIQMVDIRQESPPHGLSARLLRAIEERLANDEQVLIFINRRGYAPVLRCGSCGWLSNCSRCSAYAVLHKGLRHYLLCHHCGEQWPVDRACPECGDPDLSPLGRGTQRLEEFLAEQFPQARVLRIDADSTRRKGAAEKLFGQVHAGEVDILVGTQMVSKGHDFKSLGLVGVLNADAALFSQDFRAPERLFAQLVQVAGRAGRHQKGAEVLVQTEYPDHPVYQALVAQDYERFANAELNERESLQLPPYSYQALLTTEAKTLKQSLGFLQQARHWAVQWLQARGWEQIQVYDPVPLHIVRVADRERAQLLVESPSRAALQQFLPAWDQMLEQLAQKMRRTYTLEVDPLSI